MLVWLLGQPHLSDYLTFVKENVVDGAALAPRGLIAEWRAANDVYADLEQREAGIAERIKCRKLPRAAKARAKQIRQEPWFDQAFGELPTSIEMVELDRLIVSQTYVDCSFAAELTAMLGADPSPEALFDLCVPTDRAMPPVRIQRHTPHHWTLSCESTDFRAHEPILLRGTDIPQRTLFGPLAAMVGVGIGFGSNCLSGVRSGTRVLLQNGYHRAYALRASGLKYAPCVIEEVTRKDELKLVASETVCDDPEFYFAAKRPPLLKDFFDPRIAKLLSILRIESSIDVEIKVKRTTPTDVAPGLGAASSIV